MSDPIEAIVEIVEELDEPGPGVTAAALRAEAEARAEGSIGKKGSK